MSIAETAKPGAETAPAAEAGRTWSTLRNRRTRYLLFFSTYFYQGLVAGFSLTALANHYAALGLSAGEVGIHFAVAGLPWTVQPILWGPLIDRASGAAMGRRRYWSVQAALGAQICLACLCFVPGPPAVIGVGMVFFAHSVFASLIDTACDRMIMDHVPAEELGRMSGCTRGGFVTGTSVSAGLFAWLLSATSFYTSAVILLVSSTLALAPIVLVREAPGDAFLSWAVRTGDGTSRSNLAFGRFLKRLGTGLHRPSSIRLLALCFGVDFALALFEVRFGVDMVQAYGWDAGALSRIQAVLALVSGTVGAVAVGVWTDRSGSLVALTGLFAAGAVAFAVTAALIVTDRVDVAGPLILGLTNILPSLVIVALVPALMQASKGRAGAATQFEVFMATMNFGSVVGGAASGAVAVVPVSATALLVVGVFAASALVSRRPDLILLRARNRSEAQADVRRSHVRQ